MTSRGAHDPMRRWWNTEPLRIDDHHRQVLRTIDGEPTSREDVAVAEGVVEALGLRPDEVLVDLCCGNGLITALLARRCRRVLALDYSQPLIDIARAGYAAPNLTYVCAAAEALSDEMLGDELADAASMVSALQFFDEHRLGAMVQSVLRLARPRFRLVLTDIPDARRRDEFYDTPEKRAAHQRRLADGSELLQHWWTPEELADLAAHQGLTARVVRRDPRLTDNHFRFDLLMER